MKTGSSSRVRQVIFKIFTVVGAITCGLLALGLVSAMFQCASEGGGVPSKTVLELRLDRPLAETQSNDPFAQVFNQDSATLHGVIEALDKAKDDDRIAGVIGYVGAQGQGMARTQELRDALARFRESGKFTVAFAESFGELSPGNQGYYLATAFEEVYLQPTGSIGLTGLMSEAMFVKGTLEKLDVTAQGDHRKEYKNALNMFTERRFTDAHREATKAILDDAYGEMVSGIATARGLSEDEVRKLIDKGPYLGQEALDAKLVDGLAYRDEVLAKVKERAGEDAKLLYATKYMQKAGRLYDGDEKIAIIYGVGAVVQGPSSADPLSGETSLGSDTVGAAFRQAIEDEDVKAIVFRVDSPGGSAVASDVVWRETVRAKEAGKPVIVSMGNVAGSGGYYVACAAEKIVASPSTITGSIGVLGGKPVTRRLWNKLGVTFGCGHSWRATTRTARSSTSATPDPIDATKRKKREDLVHPTIRAVIFDLGGVVMDSPLHLIAEYERELGIPENHVNRVVVDTGSDGAWSRLERGELGLDAFYPAFEAECAAAGHAIDAREMMGRISRFAKPRPVMVAAIETLRDRGLRTAALTNNWKGDQIGRRAKQLGELFDVFIESAVVGLRKPDPRIYERVCSDLEIEPSAAVFLDDIGRNLKAARALGMTTIKVTSAPQALDDLGGVLGMTFEGSA